MTGIGVTLVGFVAALEMVKVGGVVSPTVFPFMPTASISFHPVTNGEFIAIRMASTGYAVSVIFMVRILQAVPAAVTE